MLHATGANHPPSLLVSILFRILVAMNCGAMLLDDSKRILRLNDRAQAHLGEALTLQQGRLCAAERGCDALFQTMLDQALKYGGREREWRREALGLPREGQRPVVARVVSVEEEAGALLDGAALVLLLVDPEDCPTVSHGLLQQVFGLTRGEAHLANQLLCGHSLQDIATAGGVTVATVRSQTKSVFAKTHTHRQAELVGLLTRLALVSEGEAEEA